MCMYGFNLFFGVAIDTFIVRTILVPAVVGAASTWPRLAWWPGVMCDVVLGQEDEDEALRQGCVDPCECRKLNPEPVIFDRFENPGDWAHLKRMRGLLVAEGGG